MNCPCCGKEMVDKSKTTLERFYHWEDECFYYRDITIDIFVCKFCGIRKEENRWIVPKFLKPTEKQIKCISVINSVLGTDFEAVTKEQCSKVIAENIDKSRKKSKRLSHFGYCGKGYWITDDDCDWYGIDASLFY